MTTTEIGSNKCIYCNGSGKVFRTIKPCQFCKGTGIDKARDESEWIEVRDISNPIRYVLVKRTGE